VVEVKSPYEVILLPLITERAVRLSEKGKYTFVVARDATKPDIARAVEQHYRKDKVRVVAVNTMHVKSRLRGLARLRTKGHSAGWKKAIVTLAPGQRLTDFGV
jgi:large subunit ribosomal protein L23